MFRPHPFQITVSRRLGLTQSQLPFAVTKIYLHFRLNAFLFYSYRPTWLLLFADTHMTTLTYTPRGGTCFAFGNKPVLRSQTLFILLYILALLIMQHLPFDFFLSH